MAQILAVGIGYHGHNKTFIEVDGHPYVDVFVQVHFTVNKRGIQSGMTAQSNGHCLGDQIVERNTHSELLLPLRHHGLTEAHRGIHVYEHNLGDAGDRVPALEHALGNSPAHALQRHGTTGGQRRASTSGRRLCRLYGVQHVVARYPATRSGTGHGSRVNPLFLTQLAGHGRNLHPLGGG